MDLEAYFRSLTAEFETLKDRVRYFVHDAHWPTDGEWKESVLRSMLKRSAPETVTIGRGFVVSQNSCSSQIDVLIYDNSMPILYRDGDLVFISPSACRGIVEVKSNTSRTKFRSAATKLADNAEMIRSLSFDYHIFVGFFSYEVATTNCEPFLKELNLVTNGNASRIIDHVSLGSNILIKYWDRRPNHDFPAPRYDYWHLYNLVDMAPGHFIHNLLLKVSKNFMATNEHVWFPAEGMEPKLVSQLQFQSN